MKNITINSNSFLQATFHKYLSHIVMELLGFATAVIVSKLLGPELLGIWVIIKIVLSYFPYTSLGSSLALTKELGNSLGAKDYYRSKKIIENVHLIQFFLPLAILILILITSLFLNKPYSFLVPIAGLIGFFQAYQIYLIRINNAYEKHKLNARITIIKSIISFIIIIPLVYLFKLNGRIFAALAVAILISLITVILSKFKFKFSFNKPLLISIIKLGIPLAIQGFIYTSFFNTDRIIASIKLHLEDVGYYAFAFTLVTVFVGIRKTIEGVLFQRQHFIFGRDRSDYSKLFEITYDASRFASDATSFFSGLILIPFSVVIVIFLPEYMDSIQISFIIIASQIFGVINTLNTINKHHLLLKIMVFFLVFNILLNFFLSEYYGINGIAYSTLISFFLLYLTNTVYNLKIFNIKEKSKITLRLNLFPIYHLLLLQFYYFLFFSKYIVNNPSKSQIIGYSIISLLVYILFSIPTLLQIKKGISKLNKVKLKE